MGKYPQESYTVVVRVIQLECIFLQRMKKDTVQEFAGVEKVLLEKVLPRLFFGKSKNLLPIAVTLSKLRVKKASTGLKNNVT